MTGAGRATSDFGADRIAQTSLCVDGSGVSGAAPARVTAYDRGGLIVAGLLLVLVLPPVFFESWTPRFAVVIAAAPIGVLLLVAQVRRRDLAATLLAAAVVWTVLAAFTTGAVRSALLGFVGRELSALVLIAVAGLWSVGRVMSQPGRAMLAWTVLLGAALSAAVGVIQVVADVQSGPFSLLADRPIGLVPNPVYFGAVCASGLALGVRMWTPTNWRVVVGPVVVLGFATTLSGSRVALLSAGVSVLAVAALYGRSTHHLAALTALGSMGLGTLLDWGVGTGRDSISRLSDEPTTSAGRLDVWRYAMDAWLERPLTGYGFGRFRPAVQDRFTLDFVRATAQDETTQAWFDPHNAVIAVLLAVGVVGLLLFGSWFAVAASTIRGPLVWALAPLAIHWMLQPLSLATLPLAMLVFGAASQPPREPELRRVPLRLALGVGLSLGATMLIGDALFQRAVDAGDADRMATVATIWGRDPVVADVIAQVAVTDRDEDTLLWRERATDAEPDRPLWWTRLADEELRRDNTSRADRAVSTALQLQPTNPDALRVESLVAFRLGDVDRMQAALDSLCTLGLADCDLEAAEIVAEANQ